MKRPKNIAASVRQRLLNIAQNQDLDFNLVLNHYAIECLLYRLSQSPDSDRFVLKGALLFLLWAEEPIRPTRDIDLLSRGENSHEALRSQFERLCELDVEDDGIIFDADSIKVKPIRADQIYQGQRVHLLA